MRDEGYDEAVKFGGGGGVEWCCLVRSGVSWTTSCPHVIRSVSDPR